MKRSPTSIQVWIVAAVFMMSAPRLARGDGGIVQLHETQGPFSVTVFVSPQAVSVGLTDVSVLVQWRKGGEVVLDADITLALDPPAGVTNNQSDPFCGMSLPVPAFQLQDSKHLRVKARATREQASNKLLYAALLQFQGSGVWRLHVKVLRGSERAEFDCLLPVTATSGKTSGLWPYLAFPPIAITAFALNQRLRRHSLEKEY